MKHFSFLKNISLACLALASVAGMNSCSYSASSARVSRTLQSSTTATVYSYNDAATVKNRECKLAGPLPARANRALMSWLHYSEPQHWAYAYPQYYLSVTSPDGRRSVWGLCSDAHGNFVGLMVPADGTEAWDVPFSGSHTVYVCDKAHRQSLSEAIMDALKDYDEYRITTRRNAGLTHWTYLISAPTDENAKRLAKLKEAQAQAEAAKAKKAEAALESAGGDSDLDLDSFSSDDDDMSSDDVSSDSDDSSADSDDSASDSSDDSDDDE